MVPREMVVLRPYLGNFACEALEHEQGVGDEMPMSADAMGPRPTPDVETVEGSQELAVEGGSRVQVVRNASGRTRPLNQEEQAQIDLDEMVEEEAAEMERAEEARQWGLFMAGEYRSWEEWAVAAEVDGPPAKRARVQVLVQGLGGRVIRDVNWLVQLREGKQLSYSVKVQQAGLAEDEEGDPDARPSQAVGTVSHVDSLDQEQGPELVTRAKATQ